VINELQYLLINLLAVYEGDEPIDIPFDEPFDG